MTIRGHGLDLIETRRIGDVLDRHGERFLDRVFTAAEREGSTGLRRRVEHLAGRFAAKEAVAKALGTGVSDGMSWTEIEIVAQASGQPSVRLHGRAAAVAVRAGITSWSLSITHTSDHAAASAIAW